VTAGTMHAAMLHVCSHRAGRDLWWGCLQRDVVPAWAAGPHAGGREAGPPRHPLGNVSGGASILHASHSRLLYLLKSMLCLPRHTFHDDSLLSNSTYVSGLLPPFAAPVCQ
jgi:hypothetical protein